MRVITAILNNLADFPMSAVAPRTRLEALQPTPDTCGNLDIGRFLGC